MPVLEPRVLHQDRLSPQELRDFFAQGHGEGRPTTESAVAIHERIYRAMTELGSEDVLAWRTLWLRCLAAAAGLPADSQEGPEHALVELGRRRQAVFVIDGLEDHSQRLDTKVKQTALRVLLVDVMDWLRSLRGRPLGLVVFVRRDLVSRAAHQNSGQLLHRYESYALRWNEEEALRLALWVAVEAEALPRPEEAITALPYTDLVQELIELWGRKLGTEKSKEARSHLWVPAALSDFQGQVQARGRREVPGGGSEAVRSPAEPERPGAGSHRNAQGPAPLFPGEDSGD